MMPLPPSGTSLPHKRQPVPAVLQPVLGVQYWERAVTRNCCGFTGDRPRQFFAAARPRPRPLPPPSRPPSPAARPARALHGRCGARLRRWGRRAGAPASGTMRAPGRAAAAVAALLALAAPGARGQSPAPVRGPPGPLPPEEDAAAAPRVVERPEHRVASRTGWPAPAGAVSPDAGCRQAAKEVAGGILRMERPQAGAGGGLGGLVGELSPRLMRECSRFNLSPLCLQQVHSHHCR